MPKQAGIFKITGTMDDVSFFKTSDGFMVRKKTGVNGARIKSDPAFQRTRENLAEFTRAGKAGALLRRTVKTNLGIRFDKRAGNRLVAAMFRVLQTDRSPRGERTVVRGNAELLKDFEFNANATLAGTLSVKCKGQIDRTTGTMTVPVPSFVPGRAVARPEGSTHLKLVMAALGVDFETSDTESATASSEPIEVALASELPPVTLSASVTPASSRPLFLIFGVEFYQELDGRMYPIKNGAFNALTILQVDDSAN